MTHLKHPLRVLTCALALAASFNAHAWPTKPVRVIVPAAAGSAPDVAMRLIGTKMAELLKQPVVVDNKVGAGGVVAYQSFQTSKDDHTFLFAITSTTAIAPMTFKAAAGWDFTRDVQPVVRLAQTPLMIVANPASGAKTLADVLKLARDKPGQLAFATPGPNTLGHLAVALTTQAANVQFNTIPFSRTADGMTAVAGGDASFYVDGVSVVLPFVRGNRVQPIAVLSRTKLPGLEAYPLGRDTLDGLEVVGRFGLVTAKETPKPAVDAMVQAATAALADPEVTAKLVQLGLYPQPGNSAEYLATLQQESQLWNRVVRQAGIKAE